MAACLSILDCAVSTSIVDAAVLVMALLVLISAAVFLATVVVTTLVGVIRIWYPGERRRPSRWWPGKWR